MRQKDGCANLVLFVGCVMRTAVSVAIAFAAGLTSLAGVASASSFFNPVEGSIRFVNNDDKRTYMQIVDPSCVRLEVLSDSANSYPLNGTLPGNPRAKMRDLARTGRPVGRHTYVVSLHDMGTWQKLRWGEKTRLIERLMAFKLMPTEKMISSVKPHLREDMRKCLSAMRRGGDKKVKQYQDRVFEMDRSADQCESSGRVFTKTMENGRVTGLCLTQEQFDNRFNRSSPGRWVRSAENLQDSFDKVTDEIKQDQMKRDRALERQNQRDRVDREFMLPLRHILRCRRV